MDRVAEIKAMPTGTKLPDLSELPGGAPVTAARFGARVSAPRVPPTPAPYPGQRSGGGSAGDWPLSLALTLFVFGAGIIIGLFLPR